MVRVAIPCILGLGTMAWGVALETWRPDRPANQFVLAGGLAVFAFSILALLFSGGRAALQSQGRPLRTRGGLAVAFLVLLSGVAGLAFLAYRGAYFYIFHVYSNYRANPYGHANVSRTPEGWLAFDMGHGDGMVELSKYNLDATPSASELEAAADLVHATRETAAKFADFKEATTKYGYSVSLNSVVRNDGAWIDHYINPEYMKDGKELDPERPESLVFVTKPGPPRLVGIMYFMPIGKHGPQVGGPITRWHLHGKVEYCQDATGVPRTKASDGPCPPGMNTGPTPEMMHVWLVDNPYGVFTHMMAIQEGQASPSAEPHKHEH